MSDREFDPWNEAGDGGNPPRGRFWVPREARNEYLQPTSWNNPRAALVCLALLIVLVAVLVIAF